MSVLLSFSSTTDHFKRLTNCAVKEKKQAKTKKKKTTSMCMKSNYKTITFLAVMTTKLGDKEKTELFRFT